MFIIAGVSYAVVSLFALTSCLSMVMFYLFVLACIKKELQYISSSLADLRHKEVMNITTGLEDIRLNTTNTISNNTQQNITI
jgi:hypothetical protein